MFNRPTSQTAKLHSPQPSKVKEWWWAAGVVGEKKREEWNSMEYVVDLSLRPPENS